MAKLCLLFSALCILVLLPSLDFGRASISLELAAPAPKPQPQPPSPAPAPKPPAPAPPPDPHPQEKIWCVAKPSSSEEELNTNIEFVCEVQGVECEEIKEKGPCFHPNTTINHASFVMNKFFEETGRNPQACDFSNTALTVSTDPSYGKCHYT